jgi:hypothetical protein
MSGFTVRILRIIFRPFCFHILSIWLHIELQKQTRESYTFRILYMLFFLTVIQVSFCLSRLTVSHFLQTDNDSILPNCELWGFHIGVPENTVFTGHGAASLGNPIPTLRGTVLPPYSKRTWYFGACEWWQWQIPQEQNPALPNSYPIQSHTIQLSRYTKQRC